MSESKTPRAIGKRTAAIQGAQRQKLQLKLFPDSADDRRGAPNEVIRSAIFGVVRLAGANVSSICL